MWRRGTVVTIEDGSEPRAGPVLARNLTLALRRLAALHPARQRPGLGDALTSAKSVVGPVADVVRSTETGHQTCPPAGVFGPAQHSDVLPPERLHRERDTTLGQSFTPRQVLDTSAWYSYDVLP
jgi:hypothetical protein